MRTEGVSEIELYIEKLFAKEDDVLRDVRVRLKAAGKLGINIGPVEGKILQLLIKASGARNAVEIGTLFGYSSIWIAQALPPDGHLFTIERDPETARQAQLTFAGAGETGQKITLIEGEAMLRLTELAEKGPFDFVFIDANKSSYLDYLAWATAHVRKGGIIVADNTLLGGKVLSDQKPEGVSLRQWQAMRAFNQQLATSNEFSSVLLATAEGLTVAVRN